MNHRRRWWCPCWNCQWGAYTASLLSDQHRRRVRTLDFTLEDLRWRAMAEDETTLRAFLEWKLFHADRRGRDLGTP